MKSNLHHTQFATLTNELHLLCDAEHTLQIDNKHLNQLSLS